MYQQKLHLSFSPFTTPISLTPIKKKYISPAPKIVDSRIAIYPLEYRDYELYCYELACDKRANSANYKQLKWYKLLGCMAVRVLNYNVIRVNQPFFIFPNWLGCWNWLALWRGWLVRSGKRWLICPGFLLRLSYTFII